MRQFIITGAALMLTACGFTPLHAPTASGGAALPNLQLNFSQTSAQGATGDKAEYLIEQAMKDRMMATGSSPYALEMRTTVRRNALGLRSDDVASRYDMRLTVNYILREAASGDVISRDRVIAISTFNAPLDPYGTTAATDDALRRSSNDAADKLILKIAKTLKAQ